ncbi:MAG: ABC transporter permease [Chloroflexota bacterium]|nr:ABC transporter permease [Chloroflexota bacterium]
MEQEAVEAETSAGSPAWQRTLRTLLVPVLAVFTGLVIGAIVVAITDATVVAAYRTFLSAPGAALSATWQSIATAYGALFQGSIGTPSEVYQGIQAYLASGDSELLMQALWPITESLVASTPYILAGLGVALGFRCGLFNIGVEGQFFIGALCSAWVGYAFTDLPWFIHLPLAVLAGALGGAFWGAIPGYLKAVTGAHEVVNTIMMNWIAFRLSDWLLNGPMKAPGYRPITPQIEATAALPRLFPSPLRFHVGFFLALALAALVYWLLFKTTVGFEIRAVGANPDAARYAGINITWNFVLAMILSGALAGLAGATQVLGTDHWVGQGFSAGYGFDAIALALLGKSHPLGVVMAGLLFGTLRSGATRMQSMAGIPIDIISIIQALVIIFVAAPAIIRWLYRIRMPRAEEIVLTRGWGS